jgi:Skp family chaperone for outer membrane proteins
MTMTVVLSALLLAGSSAVQATQGTQTPPKPAAPAPQTPKPAAPTAPAAPVPFPTEAKVAFVNMEAVFAESRIGKQAQDRLKTLFDKLNPALQARDKEIQGLSEKINTQRGVVTATVLAGWNTDLQRLQREAQFARQEAQVQSEQLQAELLGEFEKKALPVVEGLRAEKALWFIIAIQSEGSGISVAAVMPGLDLTAEIVRRLDAIK